MSERAMQRLGKYELQNRLAQGGMGEVWKAFDSQLKRYVAIKLLRSDLRNDEEFTLRFEREAQLVAALRHPNIVQIHDFDTITGEDKNETTAYMVMDYVEGQTLAGYIRNTSRRGQFPVAEDILHLFSAVGLAIDYAHQHNMIHRDIKPANILLDQRLSGTRPMGEPVLTDFGIARLQGVASGTVAGALLGTPLYISPEQAQGRPGDQRSDLYSLGIILYEILTGVTPFRGESTMAILMQHVNEMPTPPSLINPHIPPMLSSVILKSIAKRPEDRFQNAVAMALAIAQALNMPPPRQLTQHIHNHPASSTTITSTFNASSPLYSTMLPSGHLSLPPTPDVSYNPAASKADVVHPITPVHNVQSSLPQQQEQPVQGQAIHYTPQWRQDNLYTQPSTQTPAAVEQVSAPPISAPSGWWSKKKVLVLVSMLLLLTLLGTGIGVVALHPQNTSPVSTATGRVLFSSSTGDQNYDVIRISLDNIAPPAGGHTYYAWIESVGGEGIPPHWALTVNNKAIHTGPLRYNGFNNLLAPGSLFLITDEVNPDPLTPYTDPASRLYYARLNGNKTTFTIASCTANNNTNACMG